MDKPKDSVLEKRCEKCFYYWTIDSGYGECRRDPPQIVIQGLWRNKYSTEYPVVPWTFAACSKFNKRRV